MQAVQQLVNRLANGNEQQRIVVAHTLSHLLETEEAKYRVLVGDPHSNPNLRSHYTIGKVLAVLKVSSCRILPTRHAAGPIAVIVWTEGKQMHIAAAIDIWLVNLYWLVQSFSSVSAGSSSTMGYL